MLNPRALSPVALCPVILVLAALAVTTLAAAVDPNERQEALRHLAIINKEAGILTRLAATSTAETSPTSDPRRVSAALSRAGHALTVAVESGADQDLETLYENVHRAAEEIEPALPYFPPKAGPHARLSNIRWSVGRIAPLLGLHDEKEEKFTVGPISRLQAQTLTARVTALLDRGNELSALLAQAPPDLMYGGLLRSQMSAFIDPAADLKVTARGSPPWWTPEAYQAVTRITRLVKLTRTETKKLTPPMLEGLHAVWDAAEELEAAANDIEHGARASGTDASIEYLPVPHRD